MSSPIFFLEVSEVIEAEYFIVERIGAISFEGGGGTGSRVINIWYKLC